MAKDENLTISTREEWLQPIDWTNSLPDGVTVSSVAVTHEPPSGSAVTITPTVATPISYIPIPSGLAIGTHYLHCVATTTNTNHSPEVRLIVQVNY